MEPQEQPSLPKGLALSQAGEEHAPLCSPQLQLALAAEDHVVGIRGFKTSALHHKTG